MSIHFIGGKPGGGKTLYSVRLIVDELVYGTRPVITNAALRLPELGIYLQREFPEKVIDVMSRVWLMTEEQTKRFWKVRPGWAGYEELSADDWRMGKTPDYSGVCDQGVFYVIDEVHNFFGAREWTETGRDARHYLSQHRKLNDTVVCITQATRNVDRVFRSLAQDFTHIRNLGKEQLGLFRLPRLFVRKTFGCEPGPTSQAMESGSFTLDVSGLASCYDTAAGVGIHSRVADQGERRKGLPFVFGVVGLVLFICFVAFVVPHLVSSAFASPMKAIAAHPTVSSPGPVLQENLTPKLRQDASEAMRAGRIVGVNSRASEWQGVVTNVWITGSCRLLWPWRVMLSDGRTLLVESNLCSVAFGELSSVTYEGRTFRTKR